MQFTRQEKIAFLVPQGQRSHLIGLEIGARDAPLLSREQGSVLYADFLDTESLRQQTHGGSICPERIVPVDIVTGNRPLSEALHHHVDYIVASHVIEHVPDLLGWLIDISKSLNHDGTLGLAIPDRRFTFDIFRQESTITEAVEAYLTRCDRPTIRQIFDSAWQAVPVAYEDVWDGKHNTDEKEFRKSRLVPAFELVQRVSVNKDYNDAHCWVFTPRSFLELLEYAACIELFPYTVERFAPTPKGGYEFLVFLRKSRSDARLPILQSIENARQMPQTTQPEHTYRALDASEPVAFQRSLQDARDEAEKLREEIQIMRNSRLWRIMDPMRRIGIALKSVASNTRPRVLAFRSGQSS